MTDIFKYSRQKKQGMRMLVALVLFFALSSSVFALQEVEHLTALDCGFTSASNVTCGGTKTLTCLVGSTIGGAGAGQYTAVTQVSFLVNGIEYLVSSPLSGSRTNGTWSVTLTAGQDSNGVLSLSGVKVVDSQGTTCQFTNNGVADESSPNPFCFANFTTPVSVNVDCSCSYTEISSVCGLNNVLTRVLQPSAGCADTSQITRTGVCDACVPNWGIDNLVCSSLLLNGSGTMNGTTYSVNATYTDSHYCCDLTGLKSDCTPPVSGSFLAQCRPDVWAGSANTQQGSRKQFSPTVDGSFYPEVSVSYVPETSYGRVFSPVVMDFNHDGASDVAVALTGGEVGVYDSKLLSKQYSIVSGYNTIVGDIALFGVKIEHNVSSMQGGFLSNVLPIYHPSYPGGTIRGYYQNDFDGAGLAFIVRNGVSENRFVSYQFYNGSFVQRADVVLQDDSFVTYAGEAQTPLCDDDWCFVVVGGRVIHRINPLTGSVSSSLVSSAVGSGDVFWMNSPVKVTGQSYAFKGVSALNTVNVYVCDFGTGNCFSVGTSGFPGTCYGCVANVSELTVTERKGYSGEKYLWWTQLRGSELFLMKATVHFNTVSEYVTSVDGPEGLRIASDVACSSHQIAAGICPDMNAGVLFSVGHTGDSGASQSFSGVSSFPASGSSSRVSSLLKGASCSGVQSGKVWGSECGNSVCYQWAGPSSCTVQPVCCTGGVDWNQGLFDLQRSDSFGSWTSVSVPAGMNAPHQSCSANNGRDDAIAYYGVIGDDLILLENSWYQNCSVANSLVWVYRAASSSWSLLYNSSSIYWGQLGVPYSAYFGSDIAPTKMNCGPDRCEVFTATRYGNSDNIVFSVVKTGTTYSTQLFTPVGTNGGDTINQSAVYGYAETSLAHYIMIQGASQRKLIRYDKNNLTLPILVESEAVSSNNLWFGLFSDPEDDDGIYWAVTPYGAGSTLCNATASTVKSAIWRTSRQTWLAPNGAYVGAGTKCEYDLYLERWPSSKTKVSNTDVYSSYTYGAYPTSSGKSYISYFWGFDSTGDPYLTYEAILPTRGAPQTYPSIPVTISSTGIYLFDLNTVANVSLWNTASSDIPRSPCSVLDSSVFSENTSGFVLTDGPGCVPRQSGSDFTSQQSAMYMTPAKNVVIADYSVSSPASYFWYRGSSGAGGAYRSTDFVCAAISTSSGYIGVVSKSTINSLQCPYSLASAGSQTVVAPKGVYRTSGSNTTIRSFSSGDNGYSIPVDMNSDTYTDYLTLSGTTIRALLSVPSGSVVGGSFSPGQASCSFNSETKRIEVSQTGAASTVNPSGLRFSADLKKGSLLVDASFEAAGDSLPLVLKPKIDGLYDVTLSTRDSATGDSGSTTCQVTVSGMPATKTTSYVNASCSISPGGEFNYNSLLSENGWKVQGQDPSPDGAILSLSAPAVLQYSTSCEDGKLRVDFGLVSASVPGSVKMIVLGEKGKELGGFWVLNGKVYVFDEGSTLLLTEYNQTVSEYSLEFDTESDTYSVLLDGNSVLSGVRITGGKFTGPYTGVKIIHLGGVSEFDYVRMTGLTGAAVDTRDANVQWIEAEGAKLLAQCDNRSSQRDFNVTPPGTFSYDVIREWCLANPNIKYENGRKVCGFDDLLLATRLNRNCYQEAFNYCVLVTMPSTGDLGEIVVNGKVVSRGQAGIDGATVCTAALQASVGYGSILAPFASTMGRVLIAKPYLLVFLVFVIVIWIAMARMRKA